MILWYDTTYNNIIWYDIITMMRMTGIRVRGVHASCRGQDLSRRGCASWRRRGGRCRSIMATTHTRRQHLDGKSTCRKYYMHAWQWDKHVNSISGSMCRCAWWSARLSCVPGALGCYLAVQQTAAFLWSLTTVSGVYTLMSRGAITNLSPR